MLYFIKNTSNLFQQFSAATTSSAFVIFLEHIFFSEEEHLRAEERTIQNATIKEQLSVRNAIFVKPRNGYTIDYVEILRHPTGDDAKMQEWLKQRAYYEKEYKQYEEDAAVDDSKQVIFIDWENLTIG